MAKDANPRRYWLELYEYLVNAKGDVVKRFDPQETPEAIGEALADLL